MGGVPAGGRDGDHKANLRDVAMCVKGMQDSSGKKSDSATQELINSEKSYIQYSSVLLQL